MLRRAFSNLFSLITPVRLVLLFHLSLTLGSHIRVLGPTFLVCLLLRGYISLDCLPRSEFLLRGDNRNIRLTVF